MKQPNMTFNDKQQLDTKQIRNKITNNKRLKRLE